MRERADRERMASRLESLQLQLNFAKDEHRKMELNLSSLRNIYRALYNQTYGVDPCPPRYECDGDAQQHCRQQREVKRPYRPHQFPVDHREDGEILEGEEEDMITN